MIPSILIVEDHQDSAQALAVLLRRAGHAVEVAESCQAALESAAAKTPEVVLCDIGLPDGDGCDLIRVLKKQYGVAGVAVSGYAMPADKQRYIDAGFSEFVGKPYRMEQINEAIVRARLFAPRNVSTTG
jgi:CheY-like chemotaxis protein